MALFCVICQSYLKRGVYCHFRASHLRNSETEPISLDKNANINDICEDHILKLNILPSTQIMIKGDVTLWILKNCWICTLRINTQ